MSSNNVRFGSTIDFLDSANQSLGVSLSAAQDVLTLGSASIRTTASPSDSSDLVNKSYVDNLVQGLDVKDSVRFATKDNITDLSSVTNSHTSIDFGIGESISNGDRVLVKNQTNAYQNGIYVWSSAGSLSRANDFDTTNDVSKGSYAFVYGGSQEKGKAYAVTTLGNAGSFTLNNTDANGTITFTIISNQSENVVLLDSNQTIGGSKTFTSNVSADVTGSITVGSGKTLDASSGTLSLAAGQVTNSMLATISTVGKVTNAATTATEQNTGSAIVSRDSEGSFSANTVTASTVGDHSGNVTVGSGKTIDVSSGTLTLAAGQVTNTMLATISTAGKVTNAATSASSSNSVNAIVTRDANGDFSAGTVSADTAGTHAGSVTVGSGKTLDVSSGTLTLNASQVTNAMLATINTVGKVSNSATTATESNTTSAIVARDANGDFAARTVTADTIGSVTVATGKTLDVSSGTLTLASGQVTNAMLSTITAAGKVTNAATTATDANTASAIVSRDANGDFSAGSVAADTVGNHSGSVTVGNAKTLDVSAGTLTLAPGQVTNTMLSTITAAGKVTNAATTATDANTASAIVARDGNGDFTAGTVSASTVGDHSGNVSVGSGKTLDVSSGTLNLAAGQVTNTMVSTITQAGKVSNSATTADSSNIADAIVTRDTNGDFNAGTVTANTVGSVTVGAGKTLDVSAGTLTVGNSQVTNSMLATITAVGKVENSATTATELNTSSAIVARDASGDFTAGTITASTVGTHLGNVTVGTAKTLDVSSGTLHLAAGQVTNSMLATINTGGKVTNAATTATDANTANAIIARDTNGDFTAGTANLTGVISGTVTTTSDPRLKEDMTILEDCLGKVDTINGFSFTWKDKSRGSGVQYGLNADEVESLHKDLIVTDNTGFKSVNYNGVLAVMLGAIKELKAEVKQIKEKCSC
tara:strand:+ start:2281 stop:5076 length:2796 start_codon:yes stop_codon:yes gene_type:complete